MLRTALLLLLVVCFVPKATTAKEPDTAFSVPEASQARTLTIVASQDRSGMGIAGPLQYALARDLEAAKLFRLFRSDHKLTAYTEEAINDALEGLSTELMSFVYLEAGRVSVFLFDINRRGQFIVASELLFGVGNERPTRRQIREGLTRATQEVIANYRASRFQPLPTGEKKEDDIVDYDDIDAAHRAFDARRLFHEMSKVEERPIYVGASLGMARFAAGDGAASTVDFGGFLGARLSHRLALEAGVNAFTYALGHLDVRYRVPLAEKYVSLSLSAGAARVLGVITDNQGSSPVILRNGQMMPGGGIAFEIPLLGTTMRGEFSFYAGQGSILLGTYGLAYSL